MRLPRQQLRLIGEFLQLASELEAALVRSIPPGVSPAPGLVGKCRQIEHLLEPSELAALLDVARIRNRLVHHSRGSQGVDAPLIDRTCEIIRRLDGTWTSPRVRHVESFFVDAGPALPAELKQTRLLASERLAESKSRAESVAFDASLPAKLGTASADGQVIVCYLGAMVFVIGPGLALLPDNADADSKRYFFAPMFVFSLVAICVIIPRWLAPRLRNRYERLKTAAESSKATTYAPELARLRTEIADRSRAMDEANMAVELWKRTFAPLAFEDQRYFVELARFTVGCARIESQLKRHLNIRSNGLKKLAFANRTRLPNGLYSAIMTLASYRNVILHTRGYCADIDVALASLAPVSDGLMAWLRRNQTTDGQTDASGPCS